MMHVNAETLQILTLCLIVPSFVYALVTSFWSLPLKNGPAYFLGVPVAPGFYDGPDSRWLTRYRFMLLAAFGLDFAALAVLLAMRRWDWVPIWAGGTAVFLTGTMTTFAFWARSRVGIAPPVLRAALSLQPRRLGDYIWWPAEAICLAAVACSWWLLLRHGGPVALQQPLLMTWLIGGLLPGKIIVVRQGWPIPAERAAEHREAQEAARRYSVRVLDAFGWLPASIFFVGALRTAWPPAHAGGFAEWLVIGIPFAFAILLVIVIAGQGRVLRIGRDLRPPGSWTPPFSRAALMSRAGMTWFSIWFGGVLLLILYRN
jgi:hypothetical protein